MMRNIFSAVAMIAAAGSAAAQQGDLGIPVGSTAPAAVVQTLDGKDANLSAYIGKGPVVIEFWATWCENCRELEPQLMSLVKQYAGTVQFVGVAVSANESAARVKAYAAKHAFTHAIFYDTHGIATGAYDVPATSYVVVMNKAGVIVYTGVGGDQDLAAAIKKAL
jgi:thiol-disulfide isomerase/thioredoxin